MIRPNASTTRACASKSIKRQVSVWLLPLWLALEGAMHGWAFSVGGGMPVWMTAVFSIGRSVLAYVWWRADRSQVPGTSKAPWLPGWIILWSWGGICLHLITRKSNHRMQSLLCYLAYTGALSAAYLCAGGLVVLAMENSQ